MRNLNIIIFGIILMSTMACSEMLDEVPRSVASLENSYETERDAEAAVIGAYAGLQRNGVYGQHHQYFTTDVTRHVWWNTQGGFGQYLWSPGNSQVVLPLWQEHFFSINDANAAISNIPGIDMDEDHRNRLIAEARFVRALLYFNLVRWFGDVPFKYVETESLEVLDVARDPVSDVYASITEDLEFGIEHLGFKGEVETGRATVDAAKTLLAKVYLTLGSMSQRDGLGDGKADFQRAADLAKQVIDDGRYQLVEYYPDVFRTRNHSEVIFDVKFIGGGVGEGSFIGVHMGLNGPPPIGGSWGVQVATQYYNTMFDSTDIVRKNWNTPHVRLQGDGSLTYWNNNQWWWDWTLAKHRRYPVSDGYVFRDHDQPWPVFRYAEVLLIYAEALNEVNNGPSGEVYDVLNQLRARARNVNGDGTVETLHADITPRNLTIDPGILPDISSADYPDYDSIKEYIQFERARELGGEAKRWFDLVRWGTLVERIQFLVDYVPPGFDTAEPRDWGAVASNVSEINYLLPIPAQELQVNRLMTQNPGY